MSIVVWRLNTDRRPFALVRFWLWAIRRRISDKDATVELPTGGSLKVPSWSSMGGYLFATGYTEPREQLFVSRLLAPSDVFVDVGANIGLYTVTAQLRGAVVIALEPIPKAAEVLASNLLYNSLQAEVLQLAAGAADGSARMVEADVTSHLDPEGDVVVETRRLDSIGIPEGRLTVIKIDAEGYDLQVLEGARETIERRRPVLIVEIWAGGRKVREMLEPLGYELVDFDLRSGELTEVPRDFSGNGNGIFVPDHDLAFVRERLAGRRS